MKYHLMKINYLLFLITILFTSCGNKEEFSYTIKGTIEICQTDSSHVVPFSPWVYLKTLDSIGNFCISDSCRVASDRTFTFADTISQTKLFHVEWNGKTIPLFVDADNIVMEVQFACNSREDIVMGSPSQWLCNEYMQLFYRRKAALDSLEKNHTVTAVEREKARQDSVEKYNDLMLQRVKKYNKSIVTCWFINEYIDSEYCSNYIALLDESVQHHPFINKINDKIQQFQHDKSLLEKVKVGKKLENISLPDTIGQFYSTRALRGNYLLLNIWSAHSEAVEYELACYQKLYDNYSAYNFRIYGISVDTDKELWLSMLQRLNMSWTNVNDLKGENSPLCEIIPFHLKGIPYNLLLDPEGTIIAENIKGEALIVTLDSLLRP